MKVLITGGAGYIGSLTAKKFIDAGHQVVVYDNLSSGFKENIPEGAFFVFGDIRDKALFSRVLKDQNVEAVVHFAAKLVVPESMLKPSEYYDVNVLGSLNIAECCVRASIKKLIFSSSASVYGDASTSFISEKVRPNPTSPYGFSKFVFEKILADFDIAYGLRSISLRYFNVAGASQDLKFGQRSSATHLIKVVSEVATEKRTHVEIFGSDYPTPDGTGVRDYIHVEDIALAHVLALSQLEKGCPTDIFNCGYGKGISVREVIDCMQSISPKKIKVIEAPRRSGDIVCAIADAHKIKSELGWVPEHDSLEKICQSSLDWEKRLK
jgi:UDP-glucose 4-epimerase